jgi:hypothetical protein
LAEAIPHRLLVTNPAAAMGISSTSSFAGLGGPGSGAGGMGASLPTTATSAPLAGALPVLALVSFAMMRAKAKEDPTADTRAANQFENYFQRALQSPEQERLELENLKQIVFQNPESLAIMKIAARTADPTLEHTDGGVDIVGWKGQVPEKFEALLPELEAVAEESNQANYGGLYNIGEMGLTGSPPNPYGEETRTYDKEAEAWKPKPFDDSSVNWAAVEAGLEDDPRIAQREREALEKAEASAGRRLTTRDPQHPQFEGGQ